MNPLTSKVNRTQGGEVHSVSLLHKGGMLRQYLGIFEQVDIARLQAANIGLRLVEDELLAGQRTCGYIKPPVFEGAFDEAHGDAGSHAQ